MSFDLPPHGSTEGLEGFAVEAADGRPLGRLAALNRTPDGLVLLVEDGAGQDRPLPQTLVEAVLLGPRIVRLAPAGEAALAAAPAVEPRQSFTESRQLVRYVPQELEGRVDATAATERASAWWAVAIPLFALAGFSLLPVHFVVAAEVGGAFRWAWYAVPLLILAAGGWALSKAVDADSGGSIPLREKLAALPSFVFGNSPVPTRRRRR